MGIETSQEMNGLGASFMAAILAVGGSFIAYLYIISVPFIQCYCDY